MKIINVTFDTNLNDLVKVSDRWFRIPYEFNIAIYTENSGVHRYHIDKDFHFDGRSGPRAVDWFAPNLGTKKERKAWFLHDLLSFSNLGFSFEENNDMLYYMLRKADYSWIKAKMIKMAVGLSDSYFGEPLPGDREAVNIGKVYYRWSDK